LQLSEILNLEQLVRDRAPAHVKALPLNTSKFRGEVIAFQYDAFDALIVPRTIATATFVNNLDSPASQSFSDSKGTTSTSSWTVTRGVTFGVTVNAGVNFIFSGSISVNSSVSFSKSESQSVAVQQTWSWNTSIPVPKKSRVEVSVVIHEATYRPRFTAKVRYVGAAWLYQGGNNTIGWVYDLGVLFRQYPDPRVTVVDDYTIVVEVEGVFEGVAGVNYLVKADQYPVGPGAIVSTSLLPLYQADLPTGVASLLAHGPGIGPADGISYTITGSREERRMNPVCGYNDLGFPHPGVYLIETRQYFEHSNGTLIRTWRDDVETFLRCENTA
jgi:hypothetical protein